ncbi:hypothetical protein AB3N04_03775 [Alkalihalophilus sp. As8PL]|uniref:Uncharacterized protein n=1 Tax=Alkalihalophilus sp. As8PL TaxID=3237103 RepID=A0AB39BUK0_9BACI
MDDLRKKVIINEIKHWKHSNLLPTQYCDFLLTLYTEGEEGSVPPTSGKRFLNFRLIYPFLLVQLSFFFTALVIYFTDFSSGLQMLIGLIFSIIVFFIAVSTKRELVFLKQFYSFIGALILFLVTIEAAGHFANHSNTVLSIVITVHCLAWILVGFKWKMRFFTISGILGLVVLSGFWFI